MHSIVILFLSITITSSTHNVIRGEKMPHSISCSLPNALWYGPNNQSILTNTNKYQLKSSSDNVQLTIDHFTFSDEGEYLCQNNQTIERYKLQLGQIKNVLLLYFLITFTILIFIPIFWFLGKKYSGVNQ